MELISLGIDIGGTNTVAGFVDRDGKVLAKLNIRTSDFDLLDDFLDALTLEINKCFESLQNGYRLCGIGIGAPNGNYFTGTVDFAPNLRWKGILPLAEKFHERFNVPAVLTNDANAAAIGEMMYGGARGMKDFVVVTLGTGVGSGFVVNGELVYGHDGFAGELGHTIVDIEGRFCGCGRKGCLETYTSASGLKRTVLELLEKSHVPSNLRVFSMDSISAKNIAEEANKGDAIALEAFEITGKILGLSLANTIAITSPEAIFLYGGLSKSGNVLFEPTKKYMELYLLNIFKNKVKLLCSELESDHAAILGASALVWKEMS
ncbi:MAG: ROK family protein [Bacteroidota bacterium]